MKEGNLSDKMEATKQNYKAYIGVLEGMLEDFADYDETMDFDPEHDDTYSKDIQASQIRVKAMLRNEILKLSARM